MTRLTEALERAQTAEFPAASTPAGAPADPPVDWQFEQPAVAPPVGAPTAAPSTSEGWTFGDGIAQRLVVSERVDTVMVEQYRRLAASLHHAQTKREIHTVMVASAVPAEGKTLTATNLGLTLSQSYQRRVLVIDADLRRPTLHALFNVPNTAGLTSSLVDPNVSQLPVRQVHTNLWLLPAGPRDPNPTSLLTSAAMQELLTQAAAQFDWVIVDTPPVALMPDANLLVAMIDTAILVINAGSTPYPVVQKAVTAVGPSRILGVVLNRAERSAAAEEYEYYGYYGDAAPETKRSRFAFR
jgi:capsular exopolysaccharide synthesis family protein